MSDIPRNEYPRPSMTRDGRWENLNGEWEFEFDPGESGIDREFWNRESLDGKILVPFCPESALSGLGAIDFVKSVWYRRDIDVKKREGERIILRFGAVDYYAEVYINGAHVGRHHGGYTPFSFDITDFVNDGVNSLCVHAIDDTRDPLQPRGKQCEKYIGLGCSYVRTTGIWQTVWIEYLPETYIESVKITPDTDNRSVHVSVRIEGRAAGEKVKARIFTGDVAEVTETFVSSQNHLDFTLKFPDGKDIRIWDIEKPELYDLEIELGKDKVRCYFGMRKVEIDGTRFMLNGRSVFMRLVLDQGYFPDGVYTPKSAEELKRDIELSMACGFNGARLHMKVFEPWTIYYADHLGYILWGEFASWGCDDSNKAAYLPIQSEFLSEIERDYNSPAIIGWCPLNETGTGRSVDLYRSLYDSIKAVDPIRPVIDTSGYTHVVTDIFDIHDYNQDPVTFRKRYVDEMDEGKYYVVRQGIERYDASVPYFVSEFGGTRWVIDENRKEDWGYGVAPKELEEFYERFKGLVDALLDSKHICGFCYTQLTDVFQEKNGLYTFAREAKFDTERLKKIVSRKAAIEED